MSVPWTLALKDVRAHWVRTGLTLAGLLLGLLLFCLIRSIVTSMDAVVDASAGNRLVVQSAVSLFVALPLDYQSKIAAVPECTPIAQQTTVTAANFVRRGFSLNSA